MMSYDGGCVSAGLGGYFVHGHFKVCWLQWRPEAAQRDQEVTPKVSRLQW